MLPLRPLTYALAAVVALSSGARAQSAASASSNNRAQVIAASFSKSKHLAMEKRGVRKEKYLDVRSVPAVRANPGAYAGSYEVADLGLALELAVLPDGRVAGWGMEPVELSSGVMRRFELRDGRIDGALLTASKVYASGDREKLEGVFIDKTTRTSPTGAGTTEFGLGVIGKAVHLSGLTISKFFYQPLRLEAVK